MPRPLFDARVIITHVITMPIHTKVRKIGNSYGIVLPKEALQCLQVEEGASLYLTEAPHNTLNINPERPGFDDKMKIAEDLMRRYRTTFRELAK
ncbi:MAG: AbrB/MazE/SpoVT family DNA-binding domain-containing protein [Opitutales bacterium]